MSPRVAILTGDDIRHRYFANTVSEQFDVVAVGYENISYRPADAAGDRVDQRTAQLVQHHFQERRRQERAFFGHAAAKRRDDRSCSVRHLDRRSLNTPATVAWLENRQVDVVLVYGTDLIKSPLLDRFSGRMINMHLGLSPYYRGTATNFYPLVNDEPQYVGATIHMIDAGIDTGDIIRHARPDIIATDMPHTVGCKAILSGIAAVIQTLQEFASERLSAVPQWHVPHPRLYLRKDFQPSHVVRLYDRIAAGLFPNYVKRKARVEKTVRLVGSPYDRF